jgi:hypothetical protein
MLESDLNRIESVLGIRLPLEYRELMGGYPFDDDSVAQDCAIPDDAERVIEENQGYRQDGFFGVAWPRHYFTFGHNGFGDAFYLDLSLESSPVFCAQHETGAFVQESASLRAWVEDLAQEEEAERRRMAQRHWWQLWKR